MGFVFLQGIQMELQLVLTNTSTSLHLLVGLEAISSIMRHLVRSMCPRMLVVQPDGVEIIFA